MSVRPAHFRGVRQPRVLLSTCIFLPGYLHHRRYLPRMISGHLSPVCPVGTKLIKMSHITII